MGLTVEDDLKGTDKVFVYGTLKSSYHNSRLFPDDEFTPAVTSESEYSIYDGPFPYVAEKGSNFIEGEVRTVSAKTLRTLDLLEGHPRHYCRKIVNVNVNEEVVKAWMYLVPIERMRGRAPMESDQENTPICWS